MTEQPLTQEQDHDRRLGRLEGIAEQLTEQGQQTNTRFDRIEQTIAKQGSELRQEIAAQGRRIDEQGRRIDEQGRALQQAIAEQGRRIDALTRWLVGIQIASLLALGTLILSRLP